MKLRRPLLIGLLLVLAVPVQTALLGRFALLGAKPELSTLIVVGVAMLHGPVAGALTGFFAGMLVDALTGLPDGLAAIVLALTGAAVGRIRLLIQRPSAWVPAAAAGIATAASLTAYAVLAVLVGSPVGDPRRMGLRIVLAALYAAALTPLVYPGLQRLLAERPSSVIGSVVVRR